MAPIAGRLSLSGIPLPCRRSEWPDPALNVIKVTCNIRRLCKSLWGRRGPPRVLLRGKPRSVHSCYIMHTHLPMRITMVTILVWIVAVIVVIPFVIIEIVTRLVPVVMRMRMTIIVIIAILIIVTTVIWIQSRSIARCGTPWKCPTARTRMSRMIWVHHGKSFVHLIRLFTNLQNSTPTKRTPHNTQFNVSRLCSPL